MGMFINVHCENEDCYCYEEGYCCADAGLFIDSTGECETYEPRDDWERLNDIEKEEARIGGKEDGEKHTTAD